jgi:hypothetical protein
MMRTLRKNGNLYPGFRQGDKLYSSHLMMPPERPLANHPACYPAPSDKIVNNRIKAPTDSSAADSSMVW